MERIIAAIEKVHAAEPSSTNVVVGTAVQFTVTASGTEPLQYQWQRSSGGAFVNLSDGNGVSGATTTTLAIAGAALADGRTYQVVVSNAVGASTSRPAQLNVLSSLTDVTAPGDEITSFGGESPAAEVVANAIDDTTSKYLNFGTDANETAPFVGPVGLVVTPSVGSTLLSGLRMYCANDAPDRDPVGYKLEGSNDGAPFLLIASGALSLSTGRNAGGLDLDPLLQPNQEVLFSNTAGYTSYRLTFAHVRDDANANSMQIGEVELLGVPGNGSPTAQVSIARGENGALTITSTQPGTLESTAGLNGSATQWQDDGTITGSITLSPTNQVRFFRVRTP